VEVDQVDAAGAEERIARAGYRAVLVDASAGREAAEALCRRLQEGQADPAYLAMGGASDPLRPQASGPFDATVSRPPGAADVRALYPSCVRPLVFFERGRVTLAPCASGAALEPLYFRVAGRRLRSASSAAARMTMRLSVDLSRAPARSSAVEALAREVARVAAEVGVRPEIVASPVLRASLERLGLPVRVATPRDASPSVLD
jgi:hypothetical protein